MTSMLTSGSAGRANMKAAIEKYRALFADQVGYLAAGQIINGTALLPFVKRIWKLEEIYIELMKKLGKDPNTCREIF